MSRFDDPQIQPVFHLVNGETLPGQPVSTTDYESWKHKFELALANGALFDELEDTTLDLVAGNVMYISWKRYN